MNTSASVSEFGKDLGLVHEAVITGRKAGAGTTFWSRLAHNETLFQRIVKEVLQMVVPTHPFDPVKFIAEKWAIIHEERDPRSAALSEVDFSAVLFETCLKANEPSITGEEKLARLKAVKNVRLGTTVFVGLWEDYIARKADSVLERLYDEQGITYLDFFGDILLGPDGGRYVLYFGRDASAWFWYYHWLGGGWNAHHRSASLANQNFGLGVKSS